MTHLMAYLYFTGYRDGRPKVGVVLTDGRSNDEDQTWLEAIADRKDNIRLLAVGT